MTHRDSLASISDDELFATVQHLTARSNVALADLLARPPARGRATWYPPPPGVCVALHVLHLRIAPERGCGVPAFEGRPARAPVSRASRRHRQRRDPSHRRADDRAAPWRRAARGDPPARALPEQAGALAAARRDRSEARGPRARRADRARTGRSRDAWGIRTGSRGTGAGIATGQEARRLDRGECRRHAAKRRRGSGIGSRRGASGRCGAADGLAMPGGPGGSLLRGSHRSGRAGFPHPARRVTGSLHDRRSALHAPAEAEILSEAGSCGPTSSCPSRSADEATSARSRSP